jgi:DNA-binding beta-propeller fold protein YncE
VAVSPNGKNVYVAATAGDGGLPGIGGTFDGSIAAFARQAGTGHLSQLGEPRTACIDATGAGGCAEGDGLDSASGVAVSANGRNAYVTGSAGSLAVLSRTPSTGAVQEDLGDPGRCYAEGGAGGCRDAHGLHGAQAVAVSKDGKSVYVAARGDSAVALFHRDVKTGHLTQDAGTQGCISETGADGCATGRGLTGAYDVAVSPNGTSVYVTGLGGDSVAVFHRDLKTGMLSQDAGASGCVSATGADGCAAGRGLAGAAGIAVSPDGKSVYVSAAVDSAVAVFRRNVKTGLLSQDAGPAGCVSETGAGGCATASGLAGAADVVVSANNKSVYVAALTSSAVVAFTRNPATGVLTDQRCIAQGGADGCDAGHGLDDPIALAISPDGKNVYVASFTGVSAAYHGAIAILQRSTTTGVLSQGGAGAPACMSEPASGGCAAGQALANATDVAVSPSNNSVYVVSMHYGGVAAFDRAP